MSARDDGALGASEWGVQCPDGTVWDDLARDAEQAREWAISASRFCGCEGTGHLAVTRTIPAWVPLPSPANGEEQQ